MALLSGTTITYGVTSAGGMREDLSDVIFDLFPEDTWALSNLDQESASSTYTEWMAQELATPAANIQLEGDDATFASLTAPTRYGSFLQISSKTFLASDTLEAVNKAGRNSEVARGAIVKMRELKRDMETRIVQNGISTTGALTATALNYALQNAWEQGGDARVVLCTAKQKAAIDGFTGVATRFVDVGRSQEASIIGSANLYVSDFGRHQVILNRYGRDSVVLCIDPSFWAVRYLRKPLKRELARTGDARKYQIITEWALVARNWKANSKVVACA